MRLTAADGSDITPRGTKVRALLVLLADAPGMRLPRARLQDRLWSDRAPEQGAASLRRALSDLRSALGGQAALLMSGPGWVGLDPAALRVDRPAGPDAADGYAADLDAIGDPEFEDWLRERRAALAASPAPAPALPVRTSGTVLHVPPFGSAPPLLDAVFRDAGQRLGELTPLLVLDHGAPAPPGARRVALDGAALRGAGGETLQIVATDPDTGRMIWSRIVPPGPDGPVADMRAASTALALALQDRIGLGIVRDLVGFDPDQLILLDRELAGGDTLVAPAAIPALRAFLRYTRTLERSAEPGEMDEAETLAAEAMRAAPDSALPFAVAGLIAAFKGETAAAIDLSDRAEAIDPGQFLVPMAGVISAQLSGRPDQAFELARRAQKAPSGVISPATFANMAAGSAALMRRIPEGLHQARLARGLAPHSRPALRFVAAFAYLAGEMEEAVDALTRLKALEPGFDPRQLADPDYPVINLRRAGLLDVAHAGLI